MFLLCVASMLLQRRLLQINHLLRILSFKELLLQLETFHVSSSLVKGQINQISKDPCKHDGQRMRMRKTVAEMRNTVAEMRKTVYLPHGLQLFEREVVVEQYAFR